MKQRDRIVLDLLTEYLPHIIEMAGQEKNQSQEKITKATKKHFSMSEERKLARERKQRRQRIADIYGDVFPELQDYV